MKEAQQILEELGLPEAQQNEISAYTLLALCGISPDDEWCNASRKSMQITRGIMAFVLDIHKKEYAPNTREMFRRQVLHQLVQAKVAEYNPDNPKLPVNSPNAHYAISQEALGVIQCFGTKKWKKAVEQFKLSAGDLSKRYQKERQMNLIPVKLGNGKIVKLSPGRHNEVQAAVIDDFAPRFTNGGSVLYLGDTADKNLYCDEKKLNLLGIPIDQHSKLPDIVIYDATRNWLFLIEVVTSHGPISPKRVIELEELFKDCNVGKIYITAFPDFAEYKKHSNNIAWETEVWLAESPDHMIHFNGDRFIGPR